MNLDRASVRRQYQPAMHTTEHRASRRERLLMLLLVVAVIAMLHAPLEALVGSTWGWISDQIGAVLDAR